jgi:hypothetical protein
MVKNRKDKKAAASAAARNVADARADSAMFSRFERYVNDLYDPEGARTDLVLSPSSEPHPGAPRAVPFDKDYESSVDGEIFIAKMYPRLEKTVTLNTGGAGVPAANSENSVFLDFEDTLPAQTSVGMLGRPATVMGGTTTPDFELPFEAVSVVTGGLPNLCIGASVPPASTVSFLMINRCDYGLRFTPYQRDTVTGVWSASATREVGARASLLSTFTASSANGTNGYALVVTNASDSVRALKSRFLINTSAAGGGGRIALTYPTAAPSSWSALDSSQKIDECRTVAMNMRLTCMASSLKDGGRVACALVPREFVPDPADPLGSVARLPIGSYDGKLRDGCDITWQPRRKDDYDYQPPEWDLGSYYIIVVARLAEANTSIRLKASYNYEIFSLDPNLGGMAYCPSAFGLQEVLRYVFANVPAGSSNDGHLRKKETALAILGGLAKKPLKWIMNNPEEAKRIAMKIASTVAKAAAVALI